MCTALQCTAFIGKIADHTYLFGGADQLLALVLLELLHCILVNGVNHEKYLKQYSTKQCSAIKDRDNNVNGCVDDS